MRAWPAGIRSKPVGADRRRTKTTNDKAPVVSQRKKRSRQETLEASSFTVTVVPSKRKLLQRKERKALTEVQKLS